MYSMYNTSNTCSQVPSSSTTPSKSAGHLHSKQPPPQIVLEPGTRTPIPTERRNYRDSFQAGHFIFRYHCGGDVVLSWHQVVLSRQSAMQGSTNLNKSPHIWLFFNWFKHPSTTVTNARVTFDIFLLFLLTHFLFRQEGVKTNHTTSTYIKTTVRSFTHVSRCHNPRAGMWGSSRSYQK